MISRIVAEFSSESEFVDYKRARAKLSATLQIAKHNDGLPLEMAGVGGSAILNGKSPMNSCGAVGSWRQ